AVAAGGALGTLARYLIAQGLPTGDGDFPWATFLTNVSGSLVLGFLLVLVIERFPPTRYVRPFLATGFCGAFTTFSTFAVEADLLFHGGHPGTAVAYVAASLAAGLAAVAAGMTAARVVPVAERRARHGDRDRSPGTGGRRRAEATR
ncbi:MAG TPA: fluoride efflux transporter CrcB, partial [Acidimicrobiales bacterium]|nr:fluoride efflux transporter CrcB [Acidimicrobiales bacterium]